MNTRDDIRLLKFTLKMHGTGSNGTRSVTMYNARRGMLDVD